MPAQRHPAASHGGDPVFAGIHGFLAAPQEQDVDGRDKPGHDSAIVGQVIATPFSSTKPLAFAARACR
jgi:hypothetical protein